MVVTMKFTIEAEKKSAGKPLYHMWSKCVGAGRANEGLRANWQEQLKLAVQECGFEYIRFHGLLHDDMCVYRVLNGEPVYNFQYVDELFDRMLQTGIRPFVEFGFCPADLASGARTQFWWKGNVTPPKDYGAWAELIRRLVTHWKERYGINEIRRWYYEVWNEPNLPPFWDGTKSQYFELYKVTALAVKSVDPLLKVGGPATSNYVPDDRFDGEIEDKSKHMTFQMSSADDADWQPVWMRDFLTYCQREELPVDFVSTHPYPTDFALDGHGKTSGFSRSVNSTSEDLALLTKIVQESAYPDAEIHLTEWSSSPSPRDHSHDHLPAAAFVVKANLDSTPLADSLSYWVFTDVFEEGGAGNTIFHGGFGLINYQGIAKPTFHAYRLLHSLGDLELARFEKGIVTKRSIDDKISALFYHYDEAAVSSAVPLAGTRAEAEAIQAKGSPVELELTLKGLTPGAGFEVETIGMDSGYAVPAWVRMGAPEPPGIAETCSLRDLSLATAKRMEYADESGVLKLGITMMPWELLAVREL
jgi:xylan 1,4-beta-xylosidase